MPLEGADESATETLSSEHRDLRRAPRRTLQTGAGALVGLYAATLLAPRSGEPLVVLLGIDSYGWTYLCGLITAVLTGVFIGGVVHVLTRDRRAWWAGTLSFATFVVLFLAALIGLPVALFVGLLSFKNTYREVGTVDGRVVVVQQFAGWDGDDELDAGYRSGPLVYFQARGDSFLDRPPAAMRSWSFTITSTPSTVQVHYVAGPQPHQAGVLTLPQATP